MRAVYAIDVGKTREPANFAWARVEPENATEVIGSHDIQVLVCKLVHDLDRGYSVALGFEAPLFIPRTGRHCGLEPRSRRRRKPRVVCPGGLYRGDARSPSSRLALAGALSFLRRHM